MKSIRNYAKQVGHEVIGNLTRNPDKEYFMDSFDGSKKHCGSKFYMDEAGNEYWVSKTGVCIVDAHGAVI